MRPAHRHPDVLMHSIVQLSNARVKGKRLVDRLSFERLRHGRCREDARALFVADADLPLSWFSVKKSKAVFC